ncbi:hypothetical protein [Brachyspira hyodysenteriae]|nr:hypothetical protein [Brachyspira hyodysenteriae]MCZ9929154.1 hypothetical protein [Brachyspira hyodysenteriae]
MYKRKDEIIVRRGFIFFDGIIVEGILYFEVKLVKLFMECFIGNFL